MKIDLRKRFIDPRHPEVIRIAPRLSATFDEVSLLLMDNVTEYEFYPYAKEGNLTERLLLDTTYGLRTLKQINGILRRER